MQSCDSGPEPSIDLSLIIPAHNEERYLGDTLTALHQSATSLSDVDYEIIVVNDDSSDATRKIAESHGARVQNVQLRNIGAVRNAGAEVALGRWIVFVDADTLVHAETLQLTVDALRDGWVGGGASVALGDLEKLPLVKRMMYHAVVTGWQRMGRWAAGCYMFCQADAFRSMGGFDERYYAAEEYFFSKSLKQAGEFGLISHPVITSSRKLHQYSAWQLARFLIRPLFSLKGLFRSKKGLEILYEDKR